MSAGIYDPFLNENYHTNGLERGRQVPNQTGKSICVVIFVELFSTILYMFVTIKMTRGAPSFAAGSSRPTTWSNSWKTQRCADVSGTKLCTRRY